jgi:hypothetical protein
LLTKDNILKTIFRGAMLLAPLLLTGGVIMDENTPPRLILSFKILDSNEKSEKAHFTMTTYDYLKFKVDTNIQDFDPPMAVNVILSMIFDDDAITPSEVSSQTKTHDDEWYEGHTTYMIPDEDHDMLYMIDIVTFANTKLLAFMLNENVVEMLRISHKTGKHLYEVNLTDGGKWIFKM